MATVAIMAKVATMRTGRSSLVLGPGVRGPPVETAVLSGELESEECFPMPVEDSLDGSSASSAFVALASSPKVGGAGAERFF